MDKLVINDTHHEDQDAKRPLLPLNEIVTHLFVATDKHQRLFICLVHGSLHIDEVSHFSFTRTRQVHRTESYLVRCGYFQATKLTAFSIQPVRSHPKDIFCVAVVEHFHL